MNRAQSEPIARKVGLNAADVHRRLVMTDGRNQMGPLLSAKNIERFAPTVRYTTFHDNLKSVESEMIPLQRIGRKKHRDEKFLAALRSRDDFENRVKVRFEFSFFLSRRIF